MKKYLKTAEEVIKALKDGKIVYGSKSNYDYKMIDGVIVSVNRKEGAVAVGSYVSIDMECPYIEEGPFKIEAGKFYRTRAGKKVFCYFANKDEKTLKLGIVEVGRQGPYYVTKKGIFDPNSGSLPSLDIVGPWEEE